MHKMKNILFVFSVLFCVLSCKPKSTQDNVLPPEGSKVHLAQDQVRSYIDRAIDDSIDGDYESAIAYLDTVINSHPNTIEAYTWRAEYKRMLERYDEAMNDVNKALGLKNVQYDGNDIIGPHEFDYKKPFPPGNKFDIELEFVVYERAAVNYHLGNFDQAFKDLKFCKLETSQPINTHYYMGLLLLEFGRNEEACVEFEISFSFGEEAALYYLEEYCG